MSATTRRWAGEKALAAVCLCILCGIAVAGLWPFNPFPRNDVSWLENQNGLRFGATGIAFSSANFQWTASPDAPACTLEIWMRPGRNSHVSDILTFYIPDAPQRFRLFDWGEGTLLVYRDFRSQHREIDIENAFRPGIPLLITITAGSRGTAVYLNGLLKQSSSRLTLSKSDFSGQLILGNSPLSNRAWAGEMRGIAMYGKELTAAQISRHFEAWSGGGSPPAEPDEEPVAIYTFSERSGSVVHDQMGAAPDLYIPESFVIPHKPLLLAPWKDFWWQENTLRDIAVNLLGGIFLGFFFCAYLLLKSPKWAAPATILSGIAISLAIETLQVFLPTRYSSMRDVTLNTFGTVLGVLLCNWGMVRAFLAGKRVID